jgi:hypothetical protein
MRRKGVQWLGATCSTGFSLRDFSARKTKFNPHRLKSVLLAPTLLNLRAKTAILTRKRSGTRGRNLPRGFLHLAIRGHQACNGSDRPHCVACRMGAAIV